MKAEKPRQYVVSFNDTCKQYGPFKDGAAAAKWAEKQLGTSHNWTIRPLTTPF